MTRNAGDGFAYARLDVGFLEDDAVLDLLEAGDPWAVLAYLGVLTASWQRGERVTLSWAIRRRVALVHLGPRLTALLEELVGAELLDEDGRIPAATWDRWYGPAGQRLAQLREQAVKGGQATAQRHTEGRKAGRTAGRKAGPTDRQTDDATSVASVGLSPDEPASPGGPARRSQPSDDDIDEAVANGHAGGLTPRWPPQTSIYNPDTNTWELHDR